MDESPGERAGSGGSAFPGASATQGPLRVPGKKDRRAGGMSSGPPGSSRDGDAPRPHPRGQTRGRGACMLAGDSTAGRNRTPAFNYALALSSQAADGKPWRLEPGPDEGGGST